MSLMINIACCRRLPVKSNSGYRDFTNQYEGNEVWPVRRGDDV
jgi:hypothetical protein